MLAALIDATGHGLASHAVALTARSVIIANADAGVGDIFLGLDTALQGTLGAAISIASISRGSVVFAGIGNVAAYMDLHPLLTRVGTVGGQRRKDPATAADPRRPCRREPGS